MNAMALLSLFAASQQRCDTLYSQIRTDYFDANTGLYREYAGGKEANYQPAFNWGVGVMLTAHNAMARLDRRYVKDLVAYLEAGERYWNPTGPTAGFDVLPGPPYPNDRYYDDNAWMVMALVESYEITGERRWLTRAKLALDYVLSGYDAKLGGGIYWRERDKQSKNACSCGPAAAACLAVYDHTRDKEMLQRAENLYDWTQKHLQDPSDELIWDHISLDGKVDKTKWSYNTALMIRTAKHLARVTKRPEFRTDAERMETSAAARWLRSDGAVTDEYQFGHLLVENLSPDRVNRERVLTSLSAQMTDGRVGARWGKAPAPGDRLQLIHQASVLRLVCTFELWQRRVAR
jgi:uncharacterized protein YyaL (SSP411 family)